MLRRAFILAIGLLTLASGCDRGSKKSLESARGHVAFLTKAAEADVAEVRSGLPEGAKHLVALFEKDTAPAEDLPAVRKGLKRARSKVQDLRVAKSTFFAIVDVKGVVVRNDQEQDLMVGKNAFASYPKLKQALGGKYVETAGSMPEAAGVKGPDGQWVAAQPIVSGGKTQALYVTGWSWSAYAYRLENALRGQVRDEAGADDKMPLLYVYVVVGDAAYGAPVSPAVNAKAIVDKKPLSNLKDGLFSTELEITGRDFTLAVGKTEVLGSDVGIAVLRSET